MTFYWVYEIPGPLFAVLCVGAWVALAVGGLLGTRGFVQRLWGEGGGANDIVSFYLGGVGLFYGITLGLIAAGAWQNLNDVGDRVALEAATVSALYHDVSSLPEPTATRVKTELHDYVTTVIDSVWPMAREGKFSMANAKRTKAIRDTLERFEPKTAGQVNLHAETLRELNELIKLRDLRHLSVATGIEPEVWLVAVLGGVLNIALTWLLIIPRRRAHIALNALLGTMVGLLIFLLGSMDNPFRGEYGVGADAFQTVLCEQMTTPATAVADHCAAP